MLATKLFSLAINKALIFKKKSKDLYTILKRYFNMKEKEEMKWNPYLNSSKEEKPKYLKLEYKLPKVSCCFIFNLVLILECFNDTQMISEYNWC